MDFTPIQELSLHHAINRDVPTKPFEVQPVSINGDKDLITRYRNTAINQYWRDRVLSTTYVDSTSGTDERHQHITLERLYFKLELEFDHIHVTTRDVVLVLASLAC